jgi:hypothetical protein
VGRVGAAGYLRPGEEVTVYEEMREVTMQLDEKVIFESQPAAEYHASPGISRSMLSMFARRKKLAWGYWFAPKELRQPQKEPTPAMRFGTLVHEIIFEPDFVLANNAVLPHRFWTKAKNLKRQYRNAGSSDFRKIWHPDDWARAACCAHAITSMPRLAELLAMPSKREYSIHWTDAATGLRLRCRPDWLLDAGDSIICIDLKTCQDASPQGFREAVKKWRYDFQYAHYCEGIQAATGKPVQWLFLPAESDFPHCAALHCLGQRWERDAELDWRVTLNELAWSIENDEWSETWEKQTNEL